MSDIALRFLLANLAAAVAIILVLALRRPARAAFGARLAYCLWLLVPLAALGSLLPPRIVEIARPAPAMTASYPPPSIAPDFFPASPAFTPADTPALLSAPSSDPVTPNSPAWALDPWTLDPWTLDPWTLGIIVWLAGALAMAIWQLRGQLRFLSDARAGFAGPAVAGVFKPRIITPADFEDRFEKSERDVILAHEKIHLANNDARINALVALLRCLCWFNPLVHIGAHLMRVDQELACDAAVVERHPRARAIYASALLKAQLAARPLPLGCYWPAGTEHPLTERVEMLKQAKPTRLRRHIGIAALALLTLGAGAGAWAAKPAETRVVLPHASNDEVAAKEWLDNRIAQLRLEVQNKHQPQPVHYEPQQASNNPSALSAAIASGDVRGIIAKGGTAADVAIALREKNGPQVGSAVDFREPDPATARFVRTKEGAIALAWRTQEGGSAMFAGVDFQAYAPPGGVASLPLFADAFPQTAPQPTLFTPQQSSPTSQSVSPQLPPPTMRQFPLPAPENFAVGGSPPEFDINSEVYLRGKVERIEFGDTKYVVFLRASSISRYFGDAGSHLSGIGAAYANSDLWELSPTNYFGNPDAIRGDLMGKNIEVNGVKTTTNCQPVCRIAVKDLIMPRSSEVPQPLTDMSLISQFGLWYDTTSQVRVRGVVERIEFSDRTFDAYVRSESRSVLPGRLYQVRSEYRSPRADVERVLLNKTVTVAGWRARESINTFCDPVCGVFAMTFQLEDTSAVTPAGAQLLSPSPYAQRPRGPLFLSIADLTAPITVSGRVIRYVRDAKDENPVLWIEATSVSPASTFGSTPGTTWVIAGFPFDASDDWLNHNVTIRGFNVEDKRCQPQCMMAGDTLIVRE